MATKVSYLIQVTTREGFIEAEQVTGEVVTIRNLSGLRIANGSRAVLQFAVGRCPVAAKQGKRLFVVSETTTGLALTRSTNKAEAVKAAEDRCLSVMPKQIQELAAKAIANPIEQAIRACLPPAKAPTGLEWHEPEGCTTARGWYISHDLKNSDGEPGQCVANYLDYDKLLVDSMRVHAACHYPGRASVSRCFLTVADAKAWIEAETEQAILSLRAQAAELAKVA